MSYTVEKYLRENSSLPSHPFGCWEWTGTAQGGYGRGFAGRPAHRVAYEHWCGRIPEGMQVDHTCENTRCINPAHLDLVTHEEHCRISAERRRLREISRRE